LKIVQEGDPAVIRCRCGYTLCSARENYKDQALRAVLQKAFLGMNSHHINDDRFEWVEWYCPKCLTRLSCGVALKGHEEICDIHGDIISCRLIFKGRKSHL
jgi:acetone carboxylase gamma subunit